MGEQIAELEAQNNNLQIMLQAEREVRIKKYYLQMKRRLYGQVAELEEKVKDLKDMITKHKDCWSCEHQNKNITEQPCVSCHSGCNWELKEYWYYDSQFNQGEEVNERSKTE